MRGDRRGPRPRGRGAVTRGPLEALREKIRGLPQAPGVYVIRNASGEPIYIGKASSLRARLSTHFRSSGVRDFKEGLIQRDARDVEVIPTASEAEALLVEAGLVKEHRPRYNKELKDDKSYPFLKITLEEEYPRLVLVRGRKSDGSLYFGPYTDVRLLRQALAHLRRLFPLRTCQPMPDRVCLMYHIGQCGGPCAGHQAREAYLRSVKELTLFLEGKKEALLRTLARRMADASAARRYEEARALRDQIQALSAASAPRAALDRRTTLGEMRDVLKLPAWPRRIEAFDISNFTGKNPVGSMVVFVDGKPAPDEYRSFRIRAVEGIDDYAMMREVVRRRYERALAERRPLPDLVLIDGGKGHLAAAQAELERLNLADLGLVAIAKQREELFTPGRASPHVLPQHSAVLELLRHVRDEAHRFAVRYYRKLHRRAVRFSELDGIRGVGPARKKRLMAAFPSVAALRAVSWRELRDRGGLDEKTAKNVEEYFKTR
jgi:excinuclease ABC subunit C